MLDAIALKRLGPHFDAVCSTGTQNSAYRLASSAVTYPLPTVPSRWDKPRGGAVFYVNFRDTIRGYNDLDVFQGSINLSVVPFFVKSAFCATAHFPRYINDSGVFRKALETEPPLQPCFETSYVVPSSVIFTLINRRCQFL